jgi:hypothetical protein
VRAFLPSTPAAVKTAVAGAVGFLTKEILGTTYRPGTAGQNVICRSSSVYADNAFFSGSMKSMAQYPPLYPANYYQLLNGELLYFVC